MHRRSLFQYAALTLVTALVASAPRVAVAQGGAATEVLNNGSVIQMITAKLQKSLIIAKIQGTKSAFDVTAEGLVNLTANKVPQDVMKAMMVAAAASGNRPANAGTELLTNEAVIRMITGKVPKALVLDKIRDTKGNYDVTTTGLVNLNANKVPQDVIKAMMTAAAT